MQARTRRQKEVFDYIKQYVEKYGNEPSYQMIARHLGVSSKAGIARHIKALETQGLITRRRENGSFWLDFGQSNSVSQAVCEIGWLEIPKSENYVEEWENEPLFVPRFLLGYDEPKRLRAFRVPDDAMRDKHICEGDVALIEKRSYARDNCIVVALIGGKQTVLRQFSRVGSQIELHSGNEKYEMLKLSANKIEIQGIFRGLLRPIV
jgi:repressor LexA